MEIKDVTSVSPADGTVLENSLDKHHANADIGAPHGVAVEDRDVVSVTHNVKTIEINDSRLKANGAISALNVIADKTDKIGSAVKSLEGIVAQAEGKPLPVTVKLEQEGKQLIEEVDNLIRQISTTSSETFTDDAAALAFERSVGKALELIAQNKSRGLGIKDLELANKEAILITQSKLARARSHYERLRSSVSQAAQTVKDVTMHADIAAVTRSPGISVIRQAEEAVKVTGRAREEIASDPISAIGSIGNTEGFQAQL